MSYGGRLGVQPKPSSISLEAAPWAASAFLGSVISDESAAYDATVVTLSHAP